MCEANKNESTEYHCNAKEICCKMQKDSLQLAIQNLKKIKNRDLAESILCSISDVLKAYKCLPCSCLLERIDKLLIKLIDAGIREYGKLPSYDLSSGEIVNIKMLISELENFLNS